MSTNSHLPDTDPQETTRKKLPACDYCKTRRVLCHPRPDGASCPRCLEKGVECTTTPVTRRRRRTKAELEQEKKALAATKGPTTTVLRATTNANDTISSAKDIQATSSQLRTDSDSALPQLIDAMQRNMLACSFFSPPILELPEHLVVELFQIFHELPQYYHPIIPVDRLESSLRTGAWQLSSLAPQERVLAQCIIAVASLSSINPFIIGPESYSAYDANVAFGPYPFKNTSVDLRYFGRRREAMCLQLRSEALRLAHQEGITAHASLSNAASCSLLDFLEFRTLGERTSTYASAFAYHCRDFAENAETPLSQSHADPMRWAAFLMMHALCTLLNGKSVPFTHNDELLVFEEDPPPLEHLLENLLSPTCTLEQLLSTTCPMSSHVIRLARECLEKLTGAYPRRRALNEAALTHHLVSLNLLHAVLIAYTDQSNKFERILTTNGQTFFVQGCCHALSLAWGCLILPLYEELKRRLYDDSGLLDSVNDRAEGSRSKLELFFNQVRGIAAKAAVEIGQTVAETPLLSRLTHLQFGDLEKWVMLVLEVKEAPEITPILRVQTLERLRDALKLTGFSYIDRKGLVEAIDSELSCMYSGCEQSLIPTDESVSAAVDQFTPSVPWVSSPSSFVLPLDRIGPYM